MRPPAYGEGGGEESTKVRVRAQIEQNQRAAEALDMSLGRTIEAIPHKAPLSDLSL
jgi:hypothetical protein